MSLGFGLGLRHDAGGEVVVVPADGQISVIKSGLIVRANVNRVSAVKTGIVMRNNIDRVSVIKTGIIVRAQ